MLAMFNRKFLGFLILLLILLACVVPSAGPVISTSIKFTNHILVSLTDPLDGVAYPVSAGLSVRGEAISDGSISRMELWADGELYGTYTAPEDGLGLLIHYWTWSPKTIDMHTLMVRAYNDQNQAAMSNVIHIEGIEDPGYVLIVTAEEGDTMTGIAERYKVSLDDILRENPSLTESASFSDGEDVFVRIGAPAAVIDPSATAKVLMKLNQWSLNRTQSDFVPQAAPSAPALTVSGQGCNATLNISDYAVNELGFNIYRLDSGAMSFSKVMSLPSHEDVAPLSYADSNLYGLYHYYVTAFDGNGEAASNLVSLKITDSNCAGESTPIESLALVPMSVDSYYLYLSINKGNWRRFPADDFTYLKRSDNIDFGQVANALLPNFVGDISMKGEVWTVVNGTATRLGAFEKSFKAKQAPASLEPFAFQNILLTKLEVRGIPIVGTKKYNWFTEKGMTYTPEVFRFGTDATASYGMWQVSSVPFGQDVSFNPACLLLTGKADGSGTPDAPFEFSVDFSSLKPKIENVTLSPFENVLNQEPVFSSPFSPGLDTQKGQAVSQPQWGAGAFGLGGNTPAIGFDPCAQNISAEGNITYYVRLIPMNNGQAAGTASNTVTMAYDPNGQIKITFPVPPPLPQDVYYDVKILNFTGVHVPKQEFAYCVEIVENTNPFSAHKPGDVLCPDKFAGGSKNDLLGAIEDAFNFISGLYNKLSDWVTEIVEQLNPLCIQAKLASSAIKVGEKEVKDACHYIAVIAVTAAKTYVGLPPSLPNFDQLTELGKENLVELAAQQIEDSGVPCPEDCKDVIRKGIDYATEQVKQNMNNSSCMGEAEAHANGYEPLCLPPGVVTKPDPRGQPAPAVVEVQVTRRPGAVGSNFPEPKSCSVYITAPTVNLSHAGENWLSEAGFEWAGATIEGDLFDGSGAFPQLAPGASATFPIILKPNSYWLAGHQQFVNKGWEPEHYDDWYILYSGAQATINAGGSCKFEFPEGTGFTDKVVNGDSLQVGPLGEAWKQTCYPNCP